MPCKIFLRHDQSISQRSASNSEDVWVYAPAPAWVKEGVKVIAKKLSGVEFTLLEKPTFKRGRSSSDHSTSSQAVIERFKITPDFNDDSLILLQKIARNEPRNVNGRINLSYYQPDISDEKLIYSLKDLARQTIIVGKDMTTFTGGYKSPRVEQKEPVYICDLAALQFQQPWNSGRLVLIQKSDNCKGPLDDFIFKNVVGEMRKSFDEVSKKLAENDADYIERYLKHEGFTKKSTKGTSSHCFMDAIAYKAFVKLDVILTGIALSELASAQGDKLNLKFLKYGTGYFAGKFAPQLNSLILTGVVDGIEELLDKYGESTKAVIKCLTFPFYECDSENKVRLDRIKSTYGIEYEFSRVDALKQTKSKQGLITATTNCADSNVACGNAMGFKSTDGAISENLKSKGNIFCPNMNSLMKYKYVDILKKNGD